MKKITTVIPYKPLLPKEEIKKRKIWQNKVFSELVKIKNERIVNILGINIHVLKGVFAPLWEDSRLLAGSIKNSISRKDKVLDLGSGSGIQAVLCALNGAKVTAVDINPESIKCITYNTKKLCLDNKITIKKSDLFDAISNKSFTKIIFNPPTRWFKPRNMLERACLDENYETLQKFLKNAKNYLKEDGSILLVFSTAGDIKFFEKLIRQNKYHSKILDHSRKDNWDYFVYKLKPRIL